jgi:Mg2+ and Co2+ transporter CorA
MTNRRFKLLESWFKLRTLNPLILEEALYRTERIFVETRVSLSDISELKHQMSQLRSQTVQLVDLITEDQEKAIFLFTFITVVFTPLTFVTSFFGMNTVDIRDMDNSQSTFWAAAIPVTTIIVTVSAFSVYKGTAIRKWWRQRRQRKERKTADVWGQI